MASYKPTTPTTGDPIIDTSVDKSDARSLLQQGSSGNNITDIFLALRQLGLTDDELREYLQLYLEYQVGEQNYRRSLPSSQVANLQAAGMSRSAALAMLQNGGESTTSVTPFASNQEEVRNNQFNRTMDLVKNIGVLAQQITSLASAPFDIKSKILTNRLMSNQSDMLSMQIQGMQDAATFYQAVANVDPKHELSKRSLLEQYQYIQAGSQPRALDNGYDLGTVMYANSPEFKRAASNPFFWSVLSDTMTKSNQASASVFEPERAEQIVSSLRAATRYTQNQANTELTRNRIMSVQAFRDETLAAAREDMERAKLLAEKNGYSFDSQRAEQFIERLEQFNAYDFAAMDYEIQKLTYMRDPAMVERQRLALAEELDYNVAMYLYGRSIYSLKNGVLAQMSPNLQNSGSVANLDSNVGSTGDLINWTKAYLEYCELGRTAQSNARQGIARTIFSGLGAAAGGAFVGLKLFKGIQGIQAANAAASSASVVQSGAPSIPFNLTTPLVISAPLAPYLLPQVNDYGM